MSSRPHEPTGRSATSVGFRGAMLGAFVGCVAQCLYCAGQPGFASMGPSELGLPVAIAAGLLFGAPLGAVVGALLVMLIKVDSPKLPEAPPERGPTDEEKAELRREGAEQQQQQQQRLPDQPMS